MSNQSSSPQGSSHQEDQDIQELSRQRGGAAGNLAPRQRRTQFFSLLVASVVPRPHTRRVTARWIPTGECLGDIFTKNTIEAEQFFRLWHTLCGYKSWSVLEEITGKAAAVAIEVEGRFVSVQDTRQCHLMASACHIALNTYMSTQAAGLGVGATTFQGSGCKPDQIGWTGDH